MMDVTPLIPKNRAVIDGYGSDRFRISGEVHNGSVLVFPEQVLPWSVNAVDDISEGSISEIVDCSPGPLDVILLGCGARMVFIARSIREAVLDRGVVVEIMDTGAACRTYNVLLAEERRVAAALIAV